MPPPGQGPPQPLLGPPGRPMMPPPGMGMPPGMMLSGPPPGLPPGLLAGTYGNGLNSSQGCTITYNTLTNIDLCLFIPTRTSPTDGNGNAPTAPPPFHDPTHATTNDGPAPTHIPLTCSAFFCNTIHFWGNNGSADDPTSVF
jgi:hypothetical protein